MVDLLSDLYAPVLVIFQDFLTINIKWGGVSVPVWGFFAFGLLGGLFLQILSFISGFPLGGKEE